MQVLITCDLCYGEVQSIGPQTEAGPPVRGAVMYITSCKAPLLLLPLLHRLLLIRRHLDHPWHTPRIQPAPLPSGLALRLERLSPKVIAVCGNSLFLVEVDLDEAVHLLSGAGALEGVELALLILDQARLVLGDLGR